MRAMVEKILKQYGTNVEYEGRTIRAFFQGVTGKLERLALVQPGDLGRESKKRFIYIGPVEPGIPEDGVLTVGGSGYLVRSVHQIQGTGGPVYTWAMCVEKGGEDEWAMNG